MLSHSISTLRRYVEEIFSPKAKMKAMHFLWVEKKTKKVDITISL